MDSGTGNFGRMVQGLYMARAGKLEARYFIGKEGQLGRDSGLS